MREEVLSAPLGNLGTWGYSPLLPSSVVTTKDLSFPESSLMAGVLCHIYMSLFQLMGIRLPIRKSEWTICFLKISQAIEQAGQATGGSATALSTLTHSPFYLPSFSACDILFPANYWPWKLESSPVLTTFTHRKYRLSYQ